MWYNIGLMGSEMVLWGIRLIFTKASLIQNLARCTHVLYYTKYQLLYFSRR